MAHKTIEVSRGVTIRDFLIFQLKLILDGLKDVFLFNVSIFALILDLVRGGGRKPRYFYSLLRISERFDLWLNLNGAVERMESGSGADGLFGASEAGADTLLGKIEQAVRGGDEGRKQRETETDSAEPPRSSRGDHST